MIPRLSLLLLLIASAAAAAAPDDALTAASERARADFTQRLQTATTELTETQSRIAAEKKPLLDRLHQSEQRIATLTPAIAQLETARAQADERRQRLQRDEFALQKNVTYLNTLARDGLRSVADGLMPGEAATSADEIAVLTQRCETAPKSGGVGAALASVDLMMQRLRQQLGGYARPGESLIDRDNRVTKGTFVYLGPEAFFRSDDGTVAGTVRLREGSNFAVTFPLPGWKSDRSAPLFQGQLGTMLADPSGGKALRLRETTGTLFEHIDRGGAVAYVILAVGLLAATLAGQKLWELRHLEVDAPPVVHRVIAQVFAGGAAAAAPAIAALKPSTRELLETGVRYLSQPKDVLEENLFALTLRQRLHYERRLPLLAVIATASPLLGLLGTVMGMIKTFALITVFGTGNAAKLSSGISEVLVTTELGLVVAVPTLVVHGFLSHRAQKKLSLLEHYAVEFVAAAAEARAAAIPALKA
jgi:biopolymer transport protein ExbB